MRTTITFQLDDEHDGDFDPISPENLELFKNMSKGARMSHKREEDTITLSFRGSTVRTIVALQAIVGEVYRDKVAVLDPLSREYKGN